MAAQHKHIYEPGISTDLIYQLLALPIAGSVLHIGAHPDDEDVGLISYFVRKYGVRAVYWSANRGEGGQNRIGPYSDEALGVYRTWESLEARAVDGGECLFGPFYDFGYSKNGEESLAKWGRENVVREIVRAIRIIQPQVVIARWRGEAGDFHGQHQAVGEATYEAFESAGNPNRFIELKQQGLAAWQPLKLYHSTDNSGGDLTAGGAANLTGGFNSAYERDGFVRINTGEFDPISGGTYQERAWLAYNKYQTQAMGIAPNPGDFYYYFQLHKSLAAAEQKEQSLFDGIDITLTGLADHPGGGSVFLRDSLSRVTSLTTRALEEFRADDPMGASNLLLEALSLLRKTSTELSSQDMDDEARLAILYFLSGKMRDYERVIASCLGFKLEILGDHSRIIPGERMRVTTRLWNNRETDIDQVRFKANLPDGWTAKPVATEEGTRETATTLIRDFEFTVAETADLSCPYWLLNPRETYLYPWPKGEPSSRPFGLPPVGVNCEISFGSHLLTLREPVVCREAFPGGFRELPLAVIPPISLQPKSSCEFRQVRDKQQCLELQVVARNNAGHAVEGILELEVPKSWNVEPGKINLSLPASGGTETVRHTVDIPAGTPAGRYYLRYTIRYGNRDYAVVVNPVRMGTPGLPGPADESTCIKEEYIIKQSRVMINLLDVTFVEGLRYAYVKGAKEEVPEALAPLGIDFHIIGDEEMGYIDLSEFNAVVIGPNAYLVREELRKYSSRFLEYIQQGGTLIVQFQGYRYQTPGFTPYPFSYNQPHDRVTHEEAPITILDPQHVLFRLPNAVSVNDFDHWIRERGLYFFGKHDKRYHTLLSCCDPGEEAKPGGFVECQYGKGTFVYTGYSFFRQLPAGIEGAFRLFANILALPEARILERVDFLKKISLFSLLTDKQLDSVARILSERWEEDGTYICRQGDSGDELYIVYLGQIEVLKESNDSEKRIYLAQPGDCLGEMGILADVPRTASLRTLGDVQLLVIKGTHFLSLLRQNPDISIQVIKLLVNRLASSTG